MLPSFISALPLRKLLNSHRCTHKRGSHEVCHRHPHSPRRRRSLLALVSIIQSPSEANGVPKAVFEAQQPTLAQRARTVAHVSRSGTLCTKSVRHDGVPFGSHVDYVLDEKGRPVFLLAKNAVHTMNLAADKNCSLFCQNRDTAGQGGSRATLVGSITPIDNGEDVEELKETYTWTHPYTEQALIYPELFEFYRMELEDVFFAGGYGVDATYVDLDEYSNTEADPLAFDAPGIVNEFNAQRHDELMMMCRVFLDVEKIVKASMVTLDHLGFDVRVLLEHGSTRQYRIGFRERVQNKFDVDSALVKTLQEAWEKENGFESEWEDEEMRPIGLSSAFEKNVNVEN